MANEPKDPQKPTSARDSGVNNPKRQEGASEKPSQGFGKPSTLDTLTENAVNLSNAFSSLVTGSTNLKDTLGTIGSELGKHGAAGKTASAPFFAAQKTFEIGDAGRENYKKLAEAVSASTGVITGSFMEAGKGADTFAAGLKSTAAETGQSFDTITSGVSSLMKASSDIAKSYSALDDAATKTTETFRTYAEVVRTSRNVGLELNESIDLSEQLFKQQGLTLENTTDNAESALGTMRMLNKAIEGTGLSVQAATRFVKENATAYEFLNWSSRKTSLTLGGVAQFAKQNKDIFKSTEQGINVYGKALQGTAAIQQDFGKSMFYGLMSQGGQGKGGLQAMFDFQALEGPDAMQAATDAIVSYTGGSEIRTEKDVRESGDAQAQSAYMIRTTRFQQELGLSMGEAKKYQDALSRFRAGDAAAGLEAQQIADAADPAKIREADKHLQQELYTSSELGNRILSGIKADTQRMASRIQSHITPESAEKIFKKMQDVMGDLAPKEVKEVMSALKDGGKEGGADLLKKIESIAGPEADALYDSVKALMSGKDAAADQVYDNAKKATGAAPTSPSSAPSAPTTTPPPLPSADEVQGQTSGSSSGSTTQPSSQGQSQLGKAPQASTGTKPPLGVQQPSTGGLQALKAIKGTVPELGMSTAQKNDLTYNAAAQTIFASGGAGAMDPNVLGTLASGGSSEHEYGFAMPDKGIAPNVQKSKDGGNLYVPAMGQAITPPKSELASSVQTTPWTKTGEKITSKKAAAPNMDMAAKSLTDKTQDLLSSAPVGDTSQLGAKHKPALDQLNKFVEQMKNKGTVDAAGSVEGVNAVSSEHGIYAIQQAQLKAKEEGKEELASTLSKWHEVYTKGIDLQTKQEAQAGAATSKEVAYSKLTTETSGGLDISGIGLGSASAPEDKDMLSPDYVPSTQKYVPQSKGDFMSAFKPSLKPTTTLPLAKKTEMLSSKDFPSAASLQVPQLDGGSAQAVIMDKNKKEAAAAQEAAKKTAAAQAQPAQTQAQQGSPLTAQVILNVNGNSLMEQLVHTQAFEKGVKTQVNSNLASTYKNFGEKKV